MGPCGVGWRVSEGEWEGGAPFVNYKIQFNARSPRCIRGWQGASVSLPLPVCLRFAFENSVVQSPENAAEDRASTPIECCRSSSFSLMRHWFFVAILQ